MNLSTLEIRQVHKQFPDGTIALQAIDWNVHKEETMAIIGESGSGKTTLLRLLNRLTDPTSGAVLMNGHSIYSLDPISLRRGLGYVPQEGGLLPHWTVRKNICLVPKLLEWSLQRQEERVQTLLPLVNLDPNELGERFPIELSGGQRQRVAVARALAADPPIVLLDEPFGALDPLTRRELQDQFLSIKSQLRKTMVLVTHDLSEAFKLGDRITVIKEGTIHQIGTPQELRESPATPYVASIMAHHHSHG